MCSHCKEEVNSEGNVNLSSLCPGCKEELMNEMLDRKK
jgi:predicted Zn-ribbon and HTH transcriptional regulator